MDFFIGRSSSRSPQTIPVSVQLVYNARLSLVYEKERTFSSEILRLEQGSAFSTKTEREEKGRLAFSSHLFAPACLGY